MAAQLATTVPAAAAGAAPAAASSLAAGASGLASAIAPWAGIAGAIFGAAPTSRPDQVLSGGDYVVGPFVVGSKIVGTGNEAGSTGASQATNPGDPGAILGVPGISPSLPSWLPVVIIGAAALLSVVIMSKPKNRR